MGRKIFLTVIVFLVLLYSILNLFGVRDDCEDKSCAKFLSVIKFSNWFGVVIIFLILAGLLYDIWSNP